MTEGAVKIRSDYEETAIPARKLSRVDEFHVKLEEMTCFSQIKNMIQAGWPPSKVTEFVIEQFYEDFEKLDIDADQLTSQLADYRKKLSASEMVAMRLPAEIMKAKEALEEGVDIVKELQTLYKTQKARIEIDYGTEKKLNKLFKNTGNEIAIAAGLLRDLAFLKRDLGLSAGEALESEAIRTQLITDFGLKYGKESIAKILSNPKAVSRVLSVAENLLKTVRSDQVMVKLEEAIRLENKQENSAEADLSK
jgi:hypothetical protein